MRPVVRAVVAAVTLGAVTRPAWAQTWDAFGWNLYAGTIAGEYEVRHRAYCQRPDADARSCRDVRPLPPARAGAAGPRAAAPEPAAAGLPFRRDLAVSARVRDAVLAQFADDGGRATPAVAEAVRGGRLLDAYARYAAALGLRPDDALDALAVRVITEWRLAAGVGAEPTTAQARAVRAGLAAGLTPARLAAYATDGARQAFGERLAQEAVLLEAARVAIADGRAQDWHRRARDQAAANVRRMTGVEPRELALTDQGLRPAAGGAR